MILEGDYSQMKYTSQYVKLINEGKIIIGDKMIKQLKRTINIYLAKYDFKQDEVDKKISFIENETSQTKGSHEKLSLALPQKVWLEHVFGFYTKTMVQMKDPNTMLDIEKEMEHRVIHQVPIILARGNGKTTLGSGIGLAGQMVDNEYGADIQLLASVNKQAGFIFEAIRSMISREGTVVNELYEENKLRSTRTGILYEPTNSKISIATADYDTLDGTNAHYNIFDEVHSYKDDFIKVVNDGSSKKRLNWITWYLSTNGTLRGHVFDNYYKTWSDILNGFIEADSICPFIYEIDSLDDIEGVLPDENGVVSNIENRKNFQKANPMLGIMPSLTIENIVDDMVLSKGNIISQNEILAKTFNFPTESHGSFFSNTEIRGNSDLYDDSYFVGTPENTVKAVLGCDFAETTDIATVSIMVKRDDMYYFKNFNFIPRHSLSQYSKDRRNFLISMEEKGELIIHDEDINDQEQIFEVVNDFLTENHITPILLSPDRYKAETFIRMYNDYYGIKVKLIPQGAITLSSPMKTYKALLGLGKIVFDSQLASWSHSNVVAESDTNGNIKPSKKLSTDKIDLFASQLDAFTGSILEEEHLSDYGL